MEKITQKVIEREQAYLNQRMMMDAIMPICLLENQDCMPLSLAREHKKYPKLSKDFEGVEHTAKFKLDYPFSTGLEKTVTFSSVEDIAIAVLETFEEMYSASQCVGNVPSMINLHYTGLYGDAYHSIDDLWIEGILYNPQESTLFISLGS